MTLLVKFLLKKSFISHLIILLLLTTFWGFWISDYSETFPISLSSVFTTPMLFSPPYSPNFSFSSYSFLSYSAFILSIILGGFSAYLLKTSTYRGSSTGIAASIISLNWLRHYLVIIAWLKSLWKNLFLWRASMITSGSNSLGFELHLTALEYPIGGDISGL